MKFNPLYYSPQKALSYNAYQTWVIGARDIGKTFSWQMWLLNKYEKHGHEFIYFRRYQEEINKLNLDNFIHPDIFTYIYDDIENLDISYKGGNINKTFSYYDKHTKKRKKKEIVINKKKALVDGKPFMYFKTVNMPRNLKGTEYPNVYTTLYDEVLLEPEDNQRYANDEVRKYKKMIKSVFRGRKGVKQIMLSNATDLNNPYFANLHFDKTGEDGHFHWASKTVLVEYPREKSNTVGGEAKDQLYYEWIKDDDFYETDVNNKFVVTGAANIERVRAPKYHRFNAITPKGSKISGFIINANLNHHHADKLYINHNPDPQKAFMCVEVRQVEDGHILMPPRSAKFTSWMRHKYLKNNIIYENTRAKYDFQDFIYRIL